jgi:molecular chaperone HscB
MSQTPSTEFFELFELPVSYEIDLAKLAVTYQKLQAQYHPDRFASEDAKTRRAAVENAALINQANDTLIDPLKRGCYLLKMVGSECNPGNNTISDGAFLMQQLEYRERLEEVDENEDPFAAIDQVRDDVTEHQNQLIDAFKSSYGSGDFTVALDNLTKLQFFGRLKRQLDDQEAELEDALL